MSPYWASRSENTFCQTGPTPAVTVGCFMQMLPLCYYCIIKCIKHPISFVNEAIYYLNSYF